MTDAPAFLATAERPQRADLSRLRAKVSELRDLLAAKTDLDDRLRGINKQIIEAQHKELPDLMDELGVTSLTLPAQGNAPAVKATLTPFYAANIAAAWTQERRAAAFAKLTTLGGEALIKAEVSVLFARAEHDRAQALTLELDRQGLRADLSETVNHQTLTAWVRERAERGELPSTADLDIIGAVVGRVVKCKQED